MDDDRGAAVWSWISPPWPGSFLACQPAADLGGEVTKMASPEGANLGTAA
jgi:hypothetical protein